MKILLAIICFSLLFCVAAKYRSVRTNEIENVYSFPVIQNSNWSSTAKFIAQNKQVFTTFPLVISPPIPPVDLQIGEQKSFVNFGDMLLLSENGFGYYVFDGEADKSKIDFYFNDGETSSYFSIPAVKQFANVTGDKGKAFGLFNDATRGTWIVLWGIPQQCSLEVYDKDGILKGNELIQETDFLDGKFTHYKLLTLCNDLCRVEVTTTSNSKLWGVAVTGFPDGSTQDVNPLE